MTRKERALRTSRFRSSMIHKKHFAKNRLSEKVSVAFFGQGDVVLKTTQASS